MHKHVAFGLLALTLTGCTPAAMEGLGRGLAQGASSPTEKTVGLACSGTTLGTLTRAAAELSLTVSSNGNAAGTFTNNGTVFQAEGLVPVRDDGRTLFFSTLNLKLDSRVSGGATALLGVKTGGLAGTYGSTGTLTGQIDGAGSFTGTFKGVQGSYRTTMTCRGA